MEKNRLVGKREQTKALNRAAILSAARKVFLKLGYEGAAVRDIIRQTGLAAGTFYNYFDDKEAVFRAIISEYMARLAEKVRQQRRQAHDLESFIRPAYEVFFNTIAEDPETFELTRKNESVLTTMYNSSVMQMVTMALRQDIEEAKGQGILPDIDPELLTAAFIGIGYELGQKMIQSDPMRPEVLTDFSVRLFLGGIQNIPLRQSPVMMDGLAEHAAGRMH